MRVLIFGGTTEGRELACALAKAGVAVTVSLATPLGAEELPPLPGLETRVGRLDKAGMEGLLPAFGCCVDATHPYAREVSENLRAACARTGTPLRRLLRPLEEGEGVRLVEDAGSAADYLKTTQGNILLTTGAKELPAFAALPPERLYPRVLPVVESLEACRALGIPTRQILALHGPFTQRLNEAVMEQYHIRYLVTKAAGRAGGFGEKLAAAERMGVETIVIRPPAETGEDFETVLGWVLEGSGQGWK